MRRGGPNNRVGALPIPPPQAFAQGGPSDKSEDSEPSRANSKPENQNISLIAKKLEFSIVSNSASKPPPGAAQSRAPLPPMGRTSMMPESSRSGNGQSSDRYASSASSVPEEMLRKGTHESGSEQKSEEDEEDDGNDKLKKKRIMLKVYQNYMKSYPERYEDRKSYYQKISESDVLSRFQKPTPETLVECGYNTEHYNARLRKLRK